MMTDVDGGLERVLVVRRRWSNWASVKSDVRKGSCRADDDRLLSLGSSCTVYNYKIWRDDNCTCL